MCMPGLAEKVAELVEDAVQKGAKVNSMPHLAVNISCEIVEIGWLLLRVPQ